MKKYLTLTAVLAAVAFTGFTYFAQANEPVAAPAEDMFAADYESCMAMAADKTGDEQHAAFNQCMTEKGHTEEAISTYEAAQDTMSK